MALSKEQSAVCQSSDEEFWLHCIRQWYPERRRRTHFVPSVYMNRVPCRKRRVSGENVLVHCQPEGRCNKTSRDKQSCSSTEGATPASSPDPLKLESFSGTGDKSVESQDASAAAAKAGQSTSRIAENNSGARPKVRAETGPCKWRGTIQHVSKPGPKVPGASQKWSGTLQRNLETPQRNPRTLQKNPTPQRNARTYQRYPGNSQTNPGAHNCARTRRSSSEPATVYDCDIREDRAQQRLLCCLQAFTDKYPQPMIVLSRLRFQDYLIKPWFEATCKQMRRPSDLGQTTGRGDFDVLAIHAKFGLIVFEIKAVLDYMDEESPEDNFQGVAETPEGHAVSSETIQHDIIKRVRKAIEQMKKGDEVLKHLVKGLAEGVRITQTLVLPAVSKAQLQEALLCDQQLQKDFCAVLGDPCLTASENSSRELTACINLCLCSDDLKSSNSSTTDTSDIVERLQEWWHSLVASRGEDKVMTEEVYDRLLARFCGPATTVSVPCMTPARMELRTHAQAVSETGERISRLALVPDQVDLLLSRAPCTVITGPPGTGKTVTLLLMGKQWLNDNYDVHIVSLWPESYTSCFMIFCQLLQTLDRRCDRLRCAFRLLKETVIRKCVRVRFHTFDIATDRGLWCAVSELLACRRPCGRLYLLMDECAPNKMSAKQFQKFCKAMYREITCGLYMWAATMFTPEDPEFMVHMDLTAPLRCPPKVVQEVKEAPEIQYGDIVNYQDSEVTAPCQGPQPIRVIHRTDDQKGHEGVWPYNCPVCAKEIAQELKSLNVGSTGDDASSVPPALQYRDVMILAGQLHAIGALKAALTSAGMPYSEVLPENVPGKETLARAASNSVAITTFNVARGLERKVVVVVEREWEIPDSGMRLLAMSRCTAQLIWVSRME